MSSKTTMQPDLKILQSEISNPYLLSEMVDILPNADLVLKKAGIDIDVYVEMLDDPQIIAVSQKRKRFIQSYNYRIDGDNEAYVEFVSNVISDLDMVKIIDGLFTGNQIGYAVLELIWGYDENNNLIITDVKNRNPLRFKFDTKGNLLYLDELGNYVEAPPFKFMTYTFNSLDDSNQYGKSLNSSCFWYWSFKKKGWSFWLNLLQKYGLPPLIYKAIQDEYVEDDEEEIELNLKASQLSAVQSGASIVIDKEEELKALDVKGDKDSFEKFIRIADEQIAKIYLGSPALIESAKYGTYSSTEIQMKGLEDIVIGDLKSYSNVIKKYIIEPLIFLNFGFNVKKSEIPSIVFVKDDNNSDTIDEDLEDNGDNGDNGNGRSESNKSNDSNSNNSINNGDLFSTDSKIDNYEISDELPPHTQALEKAVKNLYTKNKNVYKNIFDYKSLDNNPKKAIKQLSDFYYNSKEKLAKFTSYGIFYTYLLAKLEHSKQTSNFSLDFIKDLFEKVDLYDGAILPFEEAYKRFKKKITLSSSEFDELVEKAKSEAYRIAGIESKRIVAMTKKALEENFDNKREWKKEVKEILNKNGYDLKGNHYDTIYRTNVFQSYSVAQWYEYQATKKQFPALKYTAIMDSRVRPSHSALNGKVFMLDDPIWGIIYPPNGYNCRCTTIPVSKKKLKNVKVENGESEEWRDFKVDDGFNHNPAISIREYIPTNTKVGDNKITYKDYDLLGVVKAKLNNTLMKIEQIKQRRQYKDILGADILLEKGSTDQPRLVRDILENPSEVWLQNMKNPNGSDTFRNVYIKSYIDSDGNSVYYVVYTDKYNQFDKIIEVKNPNLYRAGALLYYANEI